MSVRILHCHSTFSLGGKEARAVRLMNAFGSQATHTILSATTDLGARAAIDPGIGVDYPTNAPSLTGKPSLGRYAALADFMRQFDLVLTYNWGAMDAVGARRLFPRDCPPLIHAEDGFNSDEAVRLKWQRNVFRRLMLPNVYKLVVPSQQLERVARSVWHQPAARVQRISNGVEVAAYGHKAARDAIPGCMPAGFNKGGKEVVIGTLAGLRSVKNISRLVRAFAQLPINTRLIIVGDGPEREALQALATQLNIADRVHFSGFLACPQRYLGHFDIFALSSDSEQFPISIVEAMATGLPIVATDVGDIRFMLPSENYPFVTKLGDDIAFADALRCLIDDPAQRAVLGTANRLHAAQTLDEASMLAAYRTLYQSALNSVRSPKSLL